VYNKPMDGKNKTRIMVFAKEISNPMQISKINSDMRMFTLSISHFQ
jgi:hypothetical protein